MGLGDTSMSKSQGMGKSQSEGALKGKKVSRKSYGGTVVGGKFTRANAGTIDELSEADKQLILADLERKKQEQVVIRKERAKLPAKRKEKEQSKADKFKEQIGDVSNQEDE